jgi:hypothetical protein
MAAERRWSPRARMACRWLRRSGCLLPAGLTLYLAVKGAHPALPGWPCPLRALTGIPCPTCFLTRATAAALAGRLETSIHLHAFGPLVALGLVAWSCSAIRQRRFLPFRIPDWGVALTALALLAYWLLRLLLERGFGLPMFPPSA